MKASQEKKKKKKEATPTHTVPSAELEAGTVLREAKSTDSCLDYFGTVGKF